jgi:hypothetical protein
MNGWPDNFASPASLFRRGDLGGTAEDGESPKKTGKRQGREPEGRAICQNERFCPGGGKIFSE